MSARLVLVEFNELTPALMYPYMEKGLLPNFRRLYKQSHVYLSDAEESGQALNPWVQWVTLHTGLSAAQHGVQKLSEGSKFQGSAVWDELSSNGYRVWVCGSMNPRYDSQLNGYLLPDPWSTNIEPFPSSTFQPYYEFIRDSVQDHANPTPSGKMRQAGDFLLFMLRHGLSVPTCLSTIKQLFAERMSDARWRRASLMDWFQWDLFKYYYQEFEPQFCTFFSNSTAHYQHHFWRDMEPEKFAMGSQGDDDAKAGAILYGYQNMDRLLGKIVNLVGDDTAIVFCTALSQRPYLEHEEHGGRVYYD